MILNLNCGYPYPYPENLTDNQSEILSQAAGDFTLELKDVIHFEWMHELTIGFKSHEAAVAAQLRTNWAWYDGATILAAPTSSEDGYIAPAIVTNGMAWCGFILLPDAT